GDGRAGRVEGREVVGRQPAIDEHPDNRLARPDGDDPLPPDRDDRTTGFPGTRGVRIDRSNVALRRPAAEATGEGCDLARPFDEEAGGPGIIVGRAQLWRRRRPRTRI